MHKKLVDKEACSLKARHESFVAMPFDHLQICQFEHYKGRGSSNSAEPIMCFVRTALKNAKQDIAERLAASKLSSSTKIRAKFTQSFFSGIQICDNVCIFSHA